MAGLADSPLKQMRWWFRTSFKTSHASNSFEASIGRSGNYFNNSLANKRVIGCSNYNDTQQMSLVLYSPLPIWTNLHNPEPNKGLNCLYSACFVLASCRCTSKQPLWPSPWAWALQCPWGCSTCRRSTWFSSTPSRMCPSAHAASRPWLLQPPCPTSSTPRPDSDPTEKLRQSCAKASKHNVRAEMLMSDWKKNTVYLFLVMFCPSVFVNQTHRCRDWKRRVKNNYLLTDV